MTNTTTAMMTNNRIIMIETMSNAKKARHFVSQTVLAVRDFENDQKPS